MASDVPERLPRRDWRDDLLVQDRQRPSEASQSSAPSVLPPPGRPETNQTWCSLPSLTQFAAQTFEHSQPSTAGSWWKPCWFPFTGIAEDQNATEDQNRTYHRVTQKISCSFALPEGLAVDIQAMISGVSQAMDVFRGFLVILFTVAHVLLTLSSAQDRLHRPASLFICNAAFVQCCAGVMLVCGYSCYARYLREWPDPSTCSWTDVFHAFSLPFVCAWICSFAFCFLGPKIDDDLTEDLKQVLLLRGPHFEGAEILLACSLNFGLVFLTRRLVSSLIDGIKGQSARYAFTMTLACSPLIITTLLQELYPNKESTSTILPHLLHFNLGILTAACWDRFLSLLKPTGFRTPNDSVQLLPWNAMKTWSAALLMVWWVLFLLFIPLGQVGFSHDLATEEVATPLGSLRSGQIGGPSPLWMLVSLWPNAMCMLSSAILVALQSFSTGLRCVKMELEHFGSNALYYLTVISIFLASLQRRSMLAGSESLASCLIGSASILAASRFLHFLAGLSHKLARE